MAIIPMWKCDRDGQLFDDKKAAEEHDKLLELAANISHWLEQSVDGIPDEAIEDIGLLMARNKDMLMKAMKGKPEVLLETQQAESAEISDNNDDNKATPISA